MPAQVLTRAQEAAQLYGLGSEDHLKSPDTELVLITDLVGADSVFEEVRQTKVCSFDVETTGFDHRLDKIVSFQISPRPGISYYFPFAHKNYDKNLDYTYCMHQMGLILADETILKVGHNLKFDYKWWLALGYEEINNVEDSMVMAHLLNESRPCGFSLKELAIYELKTKMVKFSELGIWEKHKKFKDTLLKDFSDLPILKAMPYACPDTDYSLRLRNLFAPQIEQTQFKHLFKYVEMPLMFVLARMEFRGIKVDKAYFEGLVHPYETIITDLIEAVQKMAAESGYENPPDKKGVSEPFNPASSVQVARFTELLGLTTGKYGTSGRMSVDKKGREKLAEKHPAFKLMNELAERQKMLGTYIQPLIGDHLHPTTGRVHASFNQTQTDTGRLSSSDPNMQNIPKSKGTVVRLGFIPEEGYRFVRADFSQIELRLVAHASRCTPLIEAFKRGEDIHAANAIKAFKLEEKHPGITSAILKKSSDPAMKLYRDKAKAVSFGILYGTTNYGLSKNLGCSFEEAQQLIDDFYAAFPELRVWIDKTIRFGRKMGYVETLLRRRRRFIKDSSGDYRFGSERAMQNAPIQGSSADLTKWAMVQLEKKLKPYDARMLLQIHDEIIVEAQHDCAEEVARVIKETMEDGFNFFGLQLLVEPLVEVDIQNRWSVDVDKCTACNRWSVEDTTVETKKVKQCRDCKAQF